MTRQWGVREYAGVAFGRGGGEVGGCIISGLILPVLRLNLTGILQHANVDEEIARGF